MNQPPYSYVRDSGFVVKPETGTLAWLGSEDPVDVTRTLEVSRLGDSQLNRDIFCAWRDSEASECLLVTGSPGQGKSVLSSSILDHLDIITRESEVLAGCKVIYHFCSIKNEEMYWAAIFVLRALIVQLCRDRRHFELLPATFQTDRKGFDSASVATLQDILRKLLITSHHRRIYCVVDGLDVYTNGMHDLIDFLKSVFGSIGQRIRPVLKLFCTSRPDKVILDHWGDLWRVVLRPDAEDLRIFIRSCANSLPSSRFDTTMKQLISSSLEARAGQTFLWISIIVKEILRMGMPTRGDIKSVIEGNSQDLDELYHGLVTKALQFQCNVLILIWTIYAHRPMSLSELSDAISIHPHKEYKCYQDLDETRPHVTSSAIQLNLGTLLDVIDDKVYLIHQSVKDYFDRKRPLKDVSILYNKPPRLLLAETCMVFLALEDFNEEISVSPFIVVP